MPDKKEPKPRRQRARVVLDQMVKVLNSRGEQARLLWSVVSALRGSDDENLDMKELTTARIRGIIGMAPDSLNIYVNTKPLDEGARKSRDSIVLDTRTQPHFRVHYRNAVENIRLLYHYDLEKEVDLNPSPIEPIKEENDSDNTNR